MVPNRLQRLTFSGVEVTLIVVFAILATIHVHSILRPAASGPSWSIDPDWAKVFIERYGPEHYSSGLEEYVIRDFFQDARGGIFLDVGAYRAKAGSNTYRLEHDFGWSGLAIDANGSLAMEYASARPRTQFVAAFVGDQDQGSGTLYLTGKDGAVASGDKRFTEQWGPIARTIRAPNRTLNSLLTEHQIQRIDFLSMDIELSEPAALRGFDIGSYRPRLVCVEAHPPVREAILEYFARAGYVLIGKYQAGDPLNYWFRPL